MLTWHRLCIFSRRLKTPNRLVLSTPNRRTFDAHKALKAQGNYAEHLKSIALPVGNSEVDNAAVQLAGIFNFTKLSKLAADLSAAGVQSEA